MNKSSSGTCSLATLIVIVDRGSSRSNIAREIGRDRGSCSSWLGRAFLKLIVIVDLQDLNKYPKY